MRRYRFVAARRELKTIVDLVSVGWVLEGHGANFGGVLSFEETREERQAPLGAFGGACFCLVSHLVISLRGRIEIVARHEKSNNDTCDASNTVGDYSGFSKLSKTVAVFVKIILRVRA
jgi:hypothetical protein